jgi:alpha-2-macroglobulin
VIRGAPTQVPSATEAGYKIKRMYFTLDGKPLDPSHLRQNDRLTVSIEGRNDDHEEHQTVLVDILPAGWEIEGPVVSLLEPPSADSEEEMSNSPAPHQAYAFLGPLTHPYIAEARDDRFVAAFDLSEHKANPYYMRNKELADNAFHLAYVVRVVRPGIFVLPEAVVEDMYRPGVMARTEAGQAAADPRWTCAGRPQIIPTRSSLAACSSRRRRPD